MSRSCRMVSLVEERSAIIRWSPALMRSRELRLFLRFGVVGLLNTAFGYVVFVILLTVGVWSSVALTAAALAGMAFNFQTSRHLVFRSRGDGARFVALYGSIIFANWVALRALRSAGVDELLGQALLSAPIAVFSFVIQRSFVFAPGSRRA